MQISVLHSAFVAAALSALSPEQAAVNAMVERLEVRKGMFQEGKVLLQSVHSRYFSDRVSATTRSSNGDCVYVCVCVSIPVAKGLI